MPDQPTYYEQNKELLESFKEGLFIAQYCRYMVRSLAIAMLDHVVTKKFLSQSYAISEMRWLGMDKLTSPEHTLAFFNENRIKIKVWLEHLARRAGSTDAMDYSANNLHSFSSVGISGEELEAIVIKGDKKHPKYQAVAEASTKLVAITLANGFNSFIAQTKTEAKLSGK